jgi:hypothetical protein
MEATPALRHDLVDVAAGRLGRLADFGVVDERLVG